MTDTFHTYAVFTYKCGDMQWSGLNQNQGAVIGFDAEGNYFGNHPLSGSSSIGEAVSCTFDNNMRRKKRELQQTDPICNLTPDPPPDFRTECQQMGQDDISLFRKLFGANHREAPRTLADMFGPCPCTKDHADNDLGRYIKQPSDTIIGVECYVSGKPITVQTLNLTQQCCYTEDG